MAEEDGEEEENVHSARAQGSRESSCSRQCTPWILTTRFGARRWRVCARMLALCFSILKGPFRIFKLRLLYQKQNDIDHIFTCCISHKTLHGFDGWACSSLA